MCEAELLCAENIDLKDIARSRRGELISRRELIMYYITKLDSRGASERDLVLLGGNSGRWGLEKDQVRYCLREGW